MLFLIWIFFFMIYSIFDLIFSIFFNYSYIFILHIFIRGGCSVDTPQDSGGVADDAEYVRMSSKSGKDRHARSPRRFGHKHRPVMW